MHLKFIIKKNIIITGGGGFIGKNLIKRISNECENVIVIDNFISSNKNDLYKMLDENGIKNVVVCNYDITNIYLNNYVEEIKKVNNINRVDEIYHLASIASPVRYKIYDIETLDVGYIGTRNILELARKENSKILYTSTSEVYGDPLMSPQNEDYYGNVNPFGERSCYDEPKRIGETLCYVYGKKYNMDIKIARIFNTYGEYMDIEDGRIISEIFKNILFNKKLTIYGNGEQTRSFTYVEDTIEMLIKLMESKYNKPLNIGTDDEIKLNELLKIVENLFNVKLLLEYVEKTENDPMLRRPDLSRNKEYLGYNKRTSLENGLKKMFSYYNSIYGKNIQWKKE